MADRKSGLLGWIEARPLAVFALCFAAGAAIAHAALPGLWRIYKENLTTILSARNLLWMARVLLKGMGGDIEANVLPGYATMVGDASVYMIDTYAAAPLLTDYSPYK